MQPALITGSVTHETALHSAVRKDRPRLTPRLHCPGPDFSCPDSFMKQQDIAFVRHCLPDMIQFPYYADRESPWLLARALDRPAPVRALRQTGWGKLLDRPLVRPVVARCGGSLCRDDLRPVAEAQDAAGTGIPGAAAQAGLQAALSCDWFDFSLSLAEWGTGADWHWGQLSRKGGNLVVQVGFPSDHARLMGQYLQTGSRKDFEFSVHPIRVSGPPTLAWARLDVDFDSGSVLIEEVQSDWLREAGDMVRRLRRHAPKSRELRQMERYEQHLRATYARIWPRVTLLAALHIAVTELGAREVWMHRPGPGATLKHIRYTHPPRSLYSDLPKSFCFTPVRDVPGFLCRPRRKDLAKLRKRDGPLFWRLEL